jgi:lycopene beta-cyclase
MFFERKKYDLVFIGLGASNSLIINALFASNQLQHLKIAVIDPDPKTKNDKTYCFWASEKELEKLQITHLVDRSWGKLSCKPNETVDISPLRYYHVSSINLYNHVKQLLSFCNVDYCHEKVEDIEHQSDENFMVIKTANVVLHSDKIFDSRPPEWLEENKNQSFLWQSFLGWKIKTSEPVFDSNVFTMMDFGVDQSDATQFVYILPYDNNHALVELTRFGVNAIGHDYARTQLQKYCTEKRWDFELLEEEQGMIPMCSMDIKRRSVHFNHIPTGSAAGKIKPTTGYAFKEMAIDATEIAGDFSSGLNLPNREDKITRRGRFAFYDRLLLKILERYPEKGKAIFTSLFQKVDSRLVLKFLEQKTGLHEDISVLMSLPKGLFMKQALKDIICRLQPFLSYLLPLLTTILFLLLQFMELDFLGNIMLTIGLLTLGIPHGAMDHILDKKESENMTLFVIDYLIKGAAILLLWYISPFLGLIFFLIYSAWHFGQADFIQWNSGQGATSFTWGLGMLLFLLFSHAKESGEILAQIFNDFTLNAEIKRLSIIGSIGAMILMSYSLILNRNKWLLISISTMILLVYVPLLQAFGIYFICQHSMNGWNQIRKRLNKTNLELWKHALPFTLGAIILFVVFFTSFDLNWKEQIGTFFIFLSCISFPHVMNMDHFYKTNK